MLYNPISSRKSILGNHTATQLVLLLLRQGLSCAVYSRAHNGEATISLRRINNATKSKMVKMTKQMLFSTVIAIVSPSLRERSFPAAFTAELTIAIPERHLTEVKRKPLLYFGAVPTGETEQLLPGVWPFIHREVGLMPKSPRQSEKATIPKSASGPKDSCSRAGLPKPGRRRRLELNRGAGTRYPI